MQQIETAPHILKNMQSKKKKKNNEKLQYYMSSYIFLVKLKSTFNILKNKMH